MLGSTFTMKAIFVLLLLLLLVHQSGCCSPNKHLCYPRSGIVEGCIPPCQFNIPAGSKATFETLRSTAYVRVIYFEVSFYNQHGSKMEKSNHSYAWVRNDQEPFPLLPDKVETISLGTMKKKAMKLSLVYNSSTCERNSRCRQATVLWLLVKNITHEAGTIVHTLDNQDLLRYCVLKASDGTLDCSQEYKISFFFDSVSLIIKVVALLCAVYLSPLIIVHWNSGRTNHQDDVDRLMKLDSSYPVALYQLLLHLPTLRYNTWAARLTALLFFVLIIPSLVYVQLFLLYSGKMDFKQENLFYGLGWKWQTSKPDILPLITQRPESSSDYASLTWHAIVLSICCYFIMAVGISVLPRNARQKNIPCPVCTLKRTEEIKERSLSWEIWHHMHMHCIVIHKLWTTIKMVWNILTKKISQPSSNVLVWWLKASYYAFFIVPVISILVVMSFVALILAVVLLSPLFTVMMYLLLHSWILTLGIFKSRQIEGKPIVIYGSLCLVSLIILFGCLGLLWILILTFSFPSKVLFFTFMGLILNAEHTAPYLAFGSVFLLNAYSWYLRAIEKYRNVKLVLFEVCLHFHEDMAMGATDPEVKQTQEEIISFTDEGVPQIPKKLYWLVSDKVLPLPEHIFKTILRILVVSVLTYLVFAFVMTFGGANGLGNLEKSGAALLAGFLSKVGNIFANDDLGAQLEKLQLEKKIEKLVLLYCSLKVNKKDVYQHSTAV